MGHEMFGEVVWTSGADRVRPGDRVIVDPELYCGACFHCRIGQTHLCPDGMLIGRDTNGGFAEYVTAPASHVFQLPQAIDSRTAPLVQVLTTCVHAQRQVNIFPAESVVVFGLGVTGQLHVQLAKARGASPVIGVTRSPEESALISARVAKSEDYPSSISLVQRGTVQLEPLVSDVMPLGELKAAIGMLASTSGRRMKIIMDH